MNRHPSHPAPRGPQRTLVTAVGFLALAPLVLTACGSGVSSDPGGTEESGETVSITNCGRELEFDAAPSSIVGLMPSQTGTPAPTRSTKQHRGAGPDRRVFSSG